MGPTSARGLTNLRRQGECVVNVPNSKLWRNVEALAPLTGADPVPDHKKAVFRHEQDKFGASGLRAVRSQLVRPDRIAECPLQIESRVVNLHMSGEGMRFAIVEVEAVTVHAHDAILIDRSHVDTAKWRPLIYSFRHYFDLGEDLEKTFRAEV